MKNLVIFIVECNHSFLSRVKKQNIVEVFGDVRFLLLFIHSLHCDDSSISIIFKHIS